METAPKSLRLQIALFGRTNVGKSSFLNLIAGQDIAITSPVAGTTTDVVEKAMELLPLGPVVFLDTAGIDDRTELGRQRIRKTELIFHRADIVVILCEAGQWGEPEAQIMSRAADKKLPVIAVINKSDLAAPSPDFLARLRAAGVRSVIGANSIDMAGRESCLAAFKQALIDNCPEDFIVSPPLVGDLVRPGGMAVMIVPIDLQAPKGRLILPQVQTIRDALDNDASMLVVKEREYAHVLEQLKTPPDLAICDSQVVMKMVADTPKNINCTTFSILFSRLKGDMPLMARGTAAIDALQHGDKVLIAEACTHHAAADDIGRVKIPRWLRQYVGGELEVNVYAGRDYPDNLKEYKLVVHCGGCMFNRREILSRIQAAAQAGVPVTNYGMCISYVQGVLERVLSPFPAALDAFRRERARLKTLKVKP
ncbi:MAG: [FeFe] hydrogenase H-cluster maturation GTPase HydF [Victivallales bacterium]|nr:[FeFe] hydrogenase H-cluster maturation GTPase HydF [Victivallales bacterium]